MIRFISILTFSVFIFSVSGAIELKYELFNKDALKNCRCNFTLDLAPVCENRAVSYNITEMAKCVNKCSKESTHIYIVHTRSCPEKCNCNITQDFSPICGSDGVTYPNPSYISCIADCRKTGLEPVQCGFCAKRNFTKAYIDSEIMSRSLENIPLDLLRTLKECNCIVTDDFHPICGNDGSTYPNLSMLKCVKNCKNSDLKMLSCGKCSAEKDASSSVLKKQSVSKFSKEIQKCLNKCPVVLNVDSVCGSDGNSYDSSSQLSCYNTCTNNSVNIKHRGPCKQTCDCKVTDDVDPVCGSDDVTYINGATLFCMKKCKKSDLRVLHCGKCIKNASTAYKLSGYVSGRYGCITNEETAPVCGSNGVIYNNPSIFHCSTVSSNPDLYIRRCGLCKKATGESRIKSSESDDKELKSLENAAFKCDCVATATLQPVCGSDGITYPHPSYLYCIRNCKMRDMPTENLHVSYCGPCNNSTLKRETLKSDEIELSEAIKDVFDKCNCKTTREKNPVCGTDGITYNNPSIFYCTMKCSKPDIHMKHCGACKEKIEGVLPIDSLDEYPNKCPCSATREYKPVCSSDGMNYANKDVFECAEKCLNGSINVAYAGLCSDDSQDPVDQISSSRKIRSVPSTSIYYSPKECEGCRIVHEHIRPLCGTDGQTYTSPANMRCINKCKKTDIKMAYAGFCSDSSSNPLKLIPPAPIGILQGCRCIIKKDGSKPFCGTDGNTYLNPSHASCMSVCKDKIIIKDHDGPCISKKCPCFISTEASLLCGSDGKTYVNPSALACANRCNDQNIVKVYEGRCRAGDPREGDYNLLD